MEKISTKVIKYLKSILTRKNHIPESICNNKNHNSPVYRGNKPVWDAHIGKQVIPEPDEKNN